MKRFIPSTSDPLHILDSILWWNKSFNIVIGCPIEVQQMKEGLRRWQNRFWFFFIAYPIYQSERKLKKSRGYSRAGNFFSICYRILNIFPIFLFSFYRIFPELSSKLLLFLLQISSLLQMKTEFTSTLHRHTACLMSL